ncbi:ThiF family adenylyltransferase [Sinorhizobium sp. 8-89]|uniref:shikimate dehydrogenase family protein n=1 Tax=Sinorhizobium sp. 7-81 TaxID=3049087 RepID=UPI0024C2C1D2|nr:ThiF family adenylyltransferase [Sinorhizobium sp. 7-81]MDK1389799.1 ThiF family adenylyltransferase [Sinorhizobium sp. 7-81]
MKHIPNLDGRSRVYAVFGDPIAQVQTPHLINPIFAAAGANLYAVPFHVTAEHFDGAWNAFSAMSNLAGIGVTVPHKVAACARCATLTATAKAVGAVNAVQRGADGRMHGALFDGQGFVDGLGEAKSRLRDARVLMVGAGGAGRAIAFALAAEGVGQLDIIDPMGSSLVFTLEMFNAVRGRECARAADVSGGWDYDVVINASPIGIKGSAQFPMPEASLHADLLVADIASLTAQTPLLRAARAAGATTSDGNDMLSAQIKLIAGFAVGLPAGTPLGQ